MFCSLCKASEKRVRRRRGKVAPAVESSKEAVSWSPVADLVVHPLLVSAMRQGKE